MRSFLAFLLAFPLAVLVAPGARAGGYLPEGALSYHEEKLPNGLRIVAQTVRSAPYVSARLVIRTGTDDFPCADRELPHLVEHLLFSANATLDESDIDDQAASWGGEANAFTYAQDTEVVLDAHARFQADAIRLLATMMSDFAPEAEDVEREKMVVEHESGAVHSPLQMWWSRQAFTQRAGTRFSVAAGLLCDGGLTPIHHLTLAQVRHAFDTWYVPSNMILVLVGDISGDGLTTAREAFGALPARPAPREIPAHIAMPLQVDFTSGWLSGTAQLDEPSAYGISPFRDWEGYYTLLLVEAWLNDRMFRELRSDRGLTYTPSAKVDYEGPALSVTLNVQTDPADRDFVLRYLQDLVTEVRTRGIPEEDFERLRMSTLLGMAQSFERIADRADYLAAAWREIDNGGLFDTERFYRDLDYRRFRTLVARDWPARFVVVDDAPRLGWTSAILLAAGAAGLIAGLVALFVWRRLRRRQAMV